MLGSLTGYTLSYNSTHNAYREYRFDIDDNDDTNILGILVHGKMPLNIELAVNHPSVSSLLKSITVK